MIDTVAGGQIQGGVPASGIQLIDNGGMATDQDGNLYFADVSRRRIRKIRRDGIIETVGGTGLSRISGDGGPAIAAALGYPGPMAIDKSGNLFFRDQGRIRRIDLSGKITTVAATGISGSLGAEGPAVLAQIDYGYDLVVGGDGALYFTELDLNRVRKLTPDGQLVLVAGAPQLDGIYPYRSDGDGGAAVSAHLNQPYPLAADRAGNIYVAESNQKIRRITPDGIITTIAGDGIFRRDPGPGDGGPAAAAGFTLIESMATHIQGALYISDCVTANFPPVCRIRRIGLDGVINTIAGAPGTASNADGPAAAVRIAANRLAVDAQGNIYFNDGSDLAPRIRRITPTFMVETLAGGSPVSASDGPNARKTWLVEPIAIAADPSGNVYIAESRCRIRKASPDGAFTTVAGTGKCRADILDGPVATTDLSLFVRPRSNQPRPYLCIGSIWRPPEHHPGENDRSRSGNRPPAEYLGHL